MSVRVFLGDSLATRASASRTSRGNGPASSDLHRRSLGEHVTSGCARQNGWTCHVRRAPGRRGRRRARPRCPPAPVRQSPRTALKCLHVRAPRRSLITQQHISVFPRVEPAEHARTQWREVHVTQGGACVDSGWQLPDAERACERDGDVVGRLRNDGRQHGRRSWRRHLLLEEVKLRGQSITASGSPGC